MVYQSDLKFKVHFDCHNRYKKNVYFPIRSVEFMAFRRNG